jgi:hypothetical protein
VHRGSVHRRACSGWCCLDGVHLRRRHCRCCMTM